jgi:LPXTG-site transpeptidase (sortase) family protein
MTKRDKLRSFNNALTSVVVVAALYSMVIPFMPGLKYRFITSKNPAAPYSGQLATVSGNKPADKPVELPKANRIVIPSARIDQPIIEGSGLWVIDSGGSWRKNLWVQSPKDVGNTVIVGHRFTYTNPDGAFYHLDKVGVGDKLALYWEGEELLYEVSEIKVVPADAVAVEANTGDRTLTLYTCTPLVTAENRLVVIAKPIEILTGVKK